MAPDATGRRRNVRWLLALLVGATVIASSAALAKDDEYDDDYDDDYDEDYDEKDDNGDNGDHDHGCHDPYCNGQPTETVPIPVFPSGTALALAGVGVLASVGLLLRRRL